MLRRRPTVTIDGFFDTRKLGIGYVYLAPLGLATTWLVKATTAI